MPHSLEQMVRFQRLASALEAAANDAKAARPERVEGTDSTGTVHVTLGPDALPVAISVGPDWRRAVGSEGLAAAVVEASEVAAGVRMAAWTVAIEERDMPATLARLRDEIDRDEPHGEEPTPDLVLASLLESHPPVRRRPMVEVVGDLSRVASLAAGTAVADRETRWASGSGGFGNVVVTLRVTGEVSCTADPHWVSRQEADDLTSALNGALASARAELRNGATASSTSAGDLLVELFAGMRSA